MIDSTSTLELPPNADASEVEVIAAVCIRPDGLDVAAETGLRPDHFRVELHRNIFRTALRLRDRGVQDLDPVLIVKEPGSGVTDSDLAKADELAELLGKPYLIGDMSEHCGHVIDTSQRREMRYALLDGIKAIGDGGSADDVHAAVGSAMDRVFDGGTSGPVAIGDVLLRRADRSADAARGLSSGFDSIDGMLGGLRPGHMIVLAARPGMGKSALAGCIALTVARAGDGVLFVSLEMADVELALRLLSIESGLPHSRIEENRIDDGVELDQLATAEKALASMPLRILDRPQLRVSDIATYARLLKRRHGLGLLVVDYIQLLEPTNRNPNREQQVADQSRALKMLAKSLGVPVIALAQLNRSVENRDNKRPRLSDLRESGSIEQDADSVLFLHRPGVNDPSADQRAATLTIAKNRHGQTGDIELEWIGQRMEYREVRL